jgi:hypothetical protein
MRFFAIRTDTQYDNSTTLILLDAVAEVDGFRGSTRRVVFGIEVDQQLFSFVTLQGVARSVTV